MNDIEIIALEAVASGKSPQARWPKANKKPKKAFSLIANGSRNGFTKRLETSRREIETAVRKELLEAKVLGPRLTDGNIWQSRFYAIFPLTSLSALRKWIGESRQIGTRISSDLEDAVDVALIPTIQGKAAIDFALQLSRLKPSSIVGELLQRTGRVDFLARPDSEIVNRLAMPIIEVPDELEGLIIAFRDLAGMSVFELGLPGRPELEQQKLESALTMIETVGPTLVASLASINHPVSEKLRLVLQAFGGESEAETELDQIEISEWNDAQMGLLWNAAAED